MLPSLPIQTSPETTLIQQEFVFVLLLLLISAVAIVVRKIRLPYTVALVVVGLALAILPTEGLVQLPQGFIGLPFGNGAASDEITSQLILVLLVPPLVFEAALRLNLQTLRREWLPILLLAVPGVLITALLVGNVVSLTLGVPIALAMVFGALISATDPVAVIAFFRTLGVDKRLSILLEGESLINDGVAVVLFTLAVASAGSAAIHTTLLQGAFEFVRVAGGGILVGLATGLVAAQIVSRLDDRLVETTLSMALAFGSFVGAETLDVSGILAVLTAGLVIGSLDLDKLSPTTRITLYNFWDLLAFVANSAVFLILGLQIDMAGLIDHAGAVAVAVLAILSSRALVVYGAAWISSRWRDPIPMRYRHVMFWGGLRGAVSLALALSLTGADSENLQVMTFGVVLFTLLVQGLTIEPLIKRLGLSNLAHTSEQQHHLARLLMLRASRRELDTLHREGLIAQPTWRAIGDMAEEDMQKVLHDHPELERRILVETRQGLLRAKRNALAEGLQRGVIGEEVYQQELEQLDRQILVWERFEEQADRPQRNDAASPAASL
jgi:CPA1 family monovalent cation:H+ antiporter